jgi:hypothetical protein
MYKLKNEKTATENESNPKMFWKKTEMKSNVLKSIHYQHPNTHMVKNVLLTKLIFAQNISNVLPKTFFNQHHIIYLKS